MIIKEIYPDLLRLGTEMSANVFCDMTDVFDSVRETVISDGRCHFNARGHVLMADKLSSHINSLMHSNAIIS